LGLYGLFTREVFGILYIKVKNKLLVFVLFGGGIFIIGWFYWFQWRPSEIRKHCFSQAKEYAQKRHAEGKDLSNALGNSLYRLCLVEHGMKPEPLINEQ
jgi:hypothetical protein